MRWSALLIVGLLSSGCVARSQYVQLQQENQRLRNRVERMENRLEAQQAEVRELMADLKPLIDRGVLKVEVLRGRVTVAVSSDVLFASGSADLTPSARRDLADVARALSRRAGDRDFQVEGHTDNEPIATAQFPDNWSLGAARALTVTRFMIENGFPRAHLSAASFADTRPVASNGTPEGRRQNRRIEIVLLPDLEDLGGPKRAAEPKPPKR